MLSIRNSLKNELLFDNVYYWCDSQIALAWIKSANKEFKAFIENSVTEIRKNRIIENWHYFKTIENPSDLTTRKQIVDLNSSKLSWEGPIFLKEHNIFENKDVIEIDIIEEKRENTVLCLCDIKNKTDLNEVLNINKYSNFKKLVRITSWVLRSVNNNKKKIKKSEVFLTDLKANELKIAEEYLIKSNQKNLLNEKNISRSNYLNLTIDEKGSIRCTGRLSLAPLPYETRSPILIDPYHPLIKLIILKIFFFFLYMKGIKIFLKIHERNKHIGYKHTLLNFDSAFGLCKGVN